MKHQKVLCIVLLTLVVSSQGQYVLLSWRGSVFVNNSEFSLNQVGEESDALSCLTSRPGCCKFPVPVGEWHYPDGQLVGRRSAGEDFFRNRNTAGHVILNRRNNAQGPRGIYYCFVPDDGGVMKKLLVGLYLAKDYPSVTKHPDSQMEAIPGSNVSFSVEAVYATSFQWYFREKPILVTSSKHVGVQTKTLTVLGVTSENVGGYHCNVSTAFHSANTYFAELALSSLPTLFIRAQDALNVLPGSTVSFLVFSFDLSVEYRWERGDGRTRLDSGLKYSGTETGNLVINDVRSSDAGTYVCVISSPGGSIRSSARLTLRVLPPILITPAMDALEVPLGTSVTFSVNASGVNLMYLWEFESGLFENPESLPTSNSRFAGVRSAILTISDVRTSDVGGYQCSVTNSGGTVTSFALLKLLKGPVIEKEAEDVFNASLGSEVKFSVTASGQFLSYMWKLGAEMTLLESGDPRVSGVTSSELVIANVSLDDAGVYVCVISNSAGFVMSNASLTIKLDTPILTSPSGHTLNVTLGSNVSLSVVATGHLLEFLWQRQDGQPLNDSSKFQGVSTRELKIRNIQLSDAGVFQCHISNSGGSVVSSTIIRVVFDAPLITRSAEDALNVRLGSSVTFTIEAIGHFLEFAWQRQDGQSVLQSPRFIGIATGTLRILDVRLSDAGIYKCVVSNDAGRVRSSARLEIVLEAPSIKIPAVDVLNVTEGSDVVFEVSATGDFLEYMWERQPGVSLLQDSRFTGVQTGRLMIHDVRTADAGVYICVVSNEAGTVSSSAVLSVVSSPSTVESIAVLPSISSAIISWTFYNSSVDSVSLFEVQYFPVFFPMASISLTTPEASVTLMGLIPQLQYQIRVRVSNQNAWTSSEMILDEKIPPAESFTAEMVNGSRVKLSWSPVHLEGWNISHYYITCHSSTPNALEDRNLFSKKFVVDGDSTQLCLTPDILLVDSELIYSFELRAAVTIEGLEGLGEVRGQAAMINVTVVQEITLFQVMFGPVDNCVKWGKEEADTIRKILRASISKAVSLRCNCSFTEASLGEDLFSCRKSAVTAIYRGTVTGPYSQRMLDYIQDWVQSDETVLLQWFIVDVYKHCPLRITSFHDSDCSIN